MAKKNSGKKKSPTPAKAADRGAARETETFGTGPMSLPLLERLIRLMNDNGLTDLQLKDGDRRIVMSRGGMGGGMNVAGGAPAARPQNMPSCPAATEGAPTGLSGARTSGMDAAGAAGLIEITSPMVGTFYASPSPDAKAYVKVGSRVTPDTDVCIIEAMKVFNNIKAETSGVIEKILCDNGQAVEYGQVLFLVRPA